MHKIQNLLPGVGLCALIALMAVGAEAIERRMFERPALEALVLAIVLGTTLRTAWRPPAYFGAGLTFSAKTLLEVAVVLLGLSVSTAALAATGPALIAGTAALVAASLAISYGIGRSFGLTHRLALLVACGNSICGNAAIAATAPVIEANGDEVASSIAFTAVLGIAVVLLLPLGGAALHLTTTQYGVFAGLTVYAVPQVIAATAPLGAASTQIGTLVKLVRVTMLGPVLLALSAMARRGSLSRTAKAHRPRAGVPLFILGFVLMIALRATGFVPSAALGAASFAANGLTIISMAALGLCVDVRSVGRAGLRVTATATASLVALCGLSLSLIWLLASKGIPA